MEYSIHDSVRKLATKLGADRNGTNIEDTLNNIAVKLGGEPTTNRGIAGAIDAITKVADIDDMHVLTTKTVTENGTYTASDDDADGYSSVTVNVPTGAETFAVTITLGDSITANKTYSEIMAAINADSKVTFTLVQGEASDVSPGYYVFINSDDASEKIIMVPVSSARLLEEKLCTVFLGINSNNEIQMIEMDEVTQP